MLIVLVVFFAALIQGMLGFGGALVAMQLLVTLVGIQTATPAFAVIGALSSLLNALRWRADVTRGDVLQLLVPAALGIPLGILILARVDTAIVTRVLGVVLIIYAGYNLLGWGVPPVRNRLWAYAAGFSSGVLSGAFNTGGPPVIVYADACGWSADRFRGNLQTYFVVISVFLIVSHFLSGHMTPDVWHTTLLGIPALLAGQMVGSRLSRHLNPLLFRRLVLVFLLLLGGQLLIF